MQWYAGSIAEAVQKARFEGAIFGVAIFGDDGNSKELESALCGDEVQNVMNTAKFVCIRITGSSPEHVQFGEIYTNAPCPSIYLIGDRGSPLEIISIPQSSFEMKEKFQSAWRRHSDSLKVSNAPATPAPAPIAPQSTSISETDSGSGISVTAQALLNANEAVRVAEVSASEECSLEEKIERAKLLVAAKRQQKLAEEAEDAKRKEKERRSAGQGLSELKRWQDAQEAKQLVEDRKKEKKDDLELRQRLREQIAADRAARNAKSNVSYLQEGPHLNATEEQSPTAGGRPVGMSVGTSPPVPKDYSGQSRLQFRLPSGSSISHAFEPSVTLGNVRTFLLDNNHVPFSQFTLSVAYPRRQFTNAEYLSTLRELGLLPSAALLVLPIGGSTLAPSLGGSGIGSWISFIVSYLMIPFTFIYSLLQRALPSSGRTSPPPRPPTRPSTSSGTGAGDASSSKRQSQASAAEERNNELRNRKGSAKKSGDGSKSTDGNIHRLRDHEDSSDEDKATWNGNSTQQM